MKLVCWTVLFALFGAPVLAQNDEEELKRISDMASRCRKESDKFREAGGRPGDPGDPALQWSATFWRYGREHVGRPAGDQATAHALSWLLFADQDKEVIAKARMLPLDFPVWDRVIEGLRHASMKTGDYTTFLDIARRLLQHSQEGTLRAAVQIALGRVYQDHEEPGKATTAFQAALREAPQSPHAEEAELLLHEMKTLQVGQAVPAFEAQTMDGKRISPAELRGKVVLLNFWASW